MKSILKLISLIPTYFAMVMLNNLENLFIDKSFINVDFVNRPTIISLIVIGLIIFLWDKLKGYRKLAISIVIVTLSSVLLNGFFVEKTMYGYMLLYYAMILNTYIFSKIFKQRFEISIFASHACLMIFATMLAMFGLLKVFIYAMVVLQVLGLIYMFFNKEKLASYDETNISSTSVLIFSVMFVLFVIGGIDRFVHTWDEYSHWAFDAKAVQYFDELSTNENVVSSTRQYPPLMSLWQYFVSRFTGFGETHLYVGLSLYILTMIMPAFCVIDKKNKAFLPLFTIIMFFGSAFFGSTYTYNSLYADYAAAVTYFTTFVIYLLYRDKDRKTMNLLLFLAMTLMVLLKPTGIINAFVFFVIAAIVDYITINDGKFNKKNFWKTIFQLWKKYYKLGISVVAVFVIWFGYVKVVNAITPMYYDVKVLPEGLETGLKYKLNGDVIVRVLYGAIMGFDNEIFGGLTLLQFYIVISLVVAVAYIIKSEGNKKEALQKILPYIIGGAVYYFLTVLAIFVTFSVYEAKEVASLGRYVNNFNVAIFLLAIVYIVQSEIITKKGGRVFVLLIFLLLVANIGVDKMTFYVTDIQTRMKTRNISYELQDKVQIINDYTEYDSQVYVLDQKDTDGIMAMWYSRYYCFPRRINAYHQSIAWKIRTEKNAYDLQDWGLTADQLSTDLVESDFDYLYLYTSDDEMFEKMKFMFDDYETAKEYKLFRVEDKNSDGVAELVGVI